jgi:hypothetical protein
MAEIQQAYSDNRRLFMNENNFGGSVSGSQKKKNIENLVSENYFTA